ncbi:MAG: hypothetical protein HQ592_18260 [Planctomycetes bacterium]|nr:hypothetical protein [Planctomycetota bacterium]
MKANVIAIACVAVVVLGAGSGCRQFIDDQMVKAQFDPRGRKIVIIPFKDQVYDYFESDDGHAVADHAGYYISAQGITPVAYELWLPPSVPALYKANAASPQTAWKEIAEVLGCDLVLVGQIEEIDAGTPDAPKLDKGTLELSARLLDVRQDCKVVWRMDHGKVVYPEEWEADEVVPVDKLSSQSLKTQLLIRAGEAVARNFHDSPGPAKH